MIFFSLTFAKWVSLVSLVHCDASGERIERLRSGEPDGKKEKEKKLADY